MLHRRQWVVYFDYKFSVVGGGGGGLRVAVSFSYKRWEAIVRKVRFALTYTFVMILALCRFPSYLRVRRRQTSGLCPCATITIDLNIHPRVRYSSSRT